LTPEAGPLVVVIRGSFPKADDYEDLEIPGADIAWLHLPGFFSPLLADPSIEAFAQGFDEALEHIFPHRPLLIVGVSTGALVALAMSSGRILGRVLVEPFLSTAPLWPFIDFLREDLRSVPQPEKARWVRAVFGVAADSFENRDYSHLVGRAQSAWVLVGSESLAPRRPVRSLPSLTSEEDRARLHAVGANIVLVSGGHDVPSNHPETFASVIARALEQAVQD
jgi:pimeloyl-ACP methyl ester carboxylesterase